MQISQRAEGELVLPLVLGLLLAGVLGKDKGVKFVCPPQPCPPVCPVPCPPVFPCPPVVTPCPPVFPCPPVSKVFFPAN